MTPLIRRSQVRPIIMLCADDFALTEGVSRSIEELSAAGRLSAASALVTTRHWPAHGTRLAALRGHIAIGLHINLTLGAPLGPMPRLAPEGRLPPVSALTGRAVVRRAIDASEIMAETSRQLAAFEQATAFPPDFVDGHQHVHALPGVRDGVLAALRERFPEGGPLVRNPSDQIGTIVGRGVAATKAIALAGLSFGFARALHAAGFATNDTFGGVTDFRPEDAHDDLRQSMLRPGRLHLVMCHPGHPDAELAALDPVTTRRGAEHDALMRDATLTGGIWRPSRTADGPVVDWSATAA